MMCGSVVMGVFDEWREWWYQAMGDSVTRVEYETGNDVVAVLTGRYTPDEEERRLGSFPKSDTTRALGRCCAAQILTVPLM